MLGLSVTLQSLIYSYNVSKHSLNDVTPEVSGIRLQREPSTIPCRSNSFLGLRFKIKECLIGQQSGAMEVST